MAGPFLISLNSNLLPLFSLSIHCLTRGKRTPNFAIQCPSFQLDCATSQHWWPKLLTCKSDVGAGLMLWRYIEQQIHLMRDLKTHSIGEKSKRMQIRCWRWIEVVEVELQISQIHGHCFCHGRHLSPFLDPIIGKFKQYSDKVTTSQIKTLNLTSYDLKEGTF